MAVVALGSVTVTAFVHVICMMHGCVQAGCATTKFLRAGGVLCANAKMRDKNEHPVCIHPDEDNPLKSVWTNIPEILWKFGVYYLASEGHTETSEQTRPILVYLHHGKYWYSRKVREQKTLTLKPIIHALHFSLTAHRSRFVKDVDKHFEMLYKLLDKHPSWKKFLDDRGVATTPRKFLVAVETGLRNFAFGDNAKMTMGVGSTRPVTKALYAKIAVWRKCECYVTAVRFRRGNTSYRKWREFDWSDFVERKMLWETFCKRHLPKSDGEDHFGGELKDPPHWTTETGDH